MSSFASILSSLQNDKAKVSTAAQPNNTARSTTAETPRPAATTPKPVPPREAVKRKRDDDVSGTVTKCPRVISTKTAQQSVFSSARPPPSKLAVGPVSGGNKSYNGTMKKGGSTSAPGQQLAPPAPNVKAPSTATNGITNATKPKRGFASLMAKAAAAQEASKVAGPDTIKHKTVEKLSKRERMRQAHEAEAAALAPGKSRKGNIVSNSTRKPQAGTGGLISTRTTTHTGKVAPKVVYQGTMRAVTSKEGDIRKQQKGAGKDKYGGYASWSDLDDAEEEDDDERSFESGSDMEEAGYDDVMEEEMRSARIARREDEEAQREEERLKREKLERKKRLMALNNNAASAKKRF